MDIFRYDIKYVEVDVICLLKVKINLDKLMNIQSKIKRRKLRNKSTNSSLKKMVLERFDEHLPFFKFKYDFSAFCYSKFPDLEYLYTFLTMTKSSCVFRTSSSSEDSHDESALCDFVKPEGGENQIISSAENNSDIEKTYENGNISHIVRTCKGEKLDAKFLSSSVINLSRRNLSEAEILLWHFRNDEKPFPYGKSTSN